MAFVQKGGYLLETEEAFFQWLNDDKNIEDLLKSTVRYMEYKKGVADALVASNMKELDSYWQSKLLSRLRTDKTVKGSFDKSYATLTKEYPKEKDLITELYYSGTTVLRSVESKGKTEEGDYLAKITSGINQVQSLKTMYEDRIKYICENYFAKRGSPTEYKKALDEKRKSIRVIVNQFIQSFTGDSNRRHRLYILNYAIDFAQNWTSFQGNYKLNLLITGGAGLGKTTFAKAIGQIFFEFGFLARDQFKIREKTDFVGQYLGQTPTKTYAVLYDSLESMLFIDEAYSVSGCGDTTGIDYGQEFIDALVDVSQKTRGLISIVAAGYKSEMHSCFLDKNPGMRRRFPNEIELTPYSIIDLDNILTNNVLKPIFPVQLNTVLKMDLLKEPEVYFTQAVKYREFGKEIVYRLPEIDPTRSLGEKVYADLLVDENRTAALQSIAKSSITDYPTILRYRTKIIGMYRFFLQLASFDTGYSSFEAMYSVHQFFWGLLTEKDPTRSYKYNNYRLLHIVYMSSNQQRREILKSYIMRKYFSEKEGSLFPNQAGDMDTLAAFIKSQPNLRNNVLPTFEEVIKLFNEYFRSRGGSKFMLRAQKTDDTIDLFIYHVGGGFVGYTDFEESVISKILESLTYDGKDIPALWKLGSQTPENRQMIIQNINQLYSTACLALLQDANDAMKSANSKEKNEKRLPSGIDIRFLEAEVNSYKSANRGEELGDSEKTKYLEYVSFEDTTDEDPSMTSKILGEITKETETVAAPLSLSLDEVALCKPYVDLSKITEVTKPAVKVEEAVKPIAKVTVTTSAAVPIPKEGDAPKPAGEAGKGLVPPPGLPPLAAPSVARSTTSYGVPPAPVKVEHPSIYLIVESKKRAVYDPDALKTVSAGIYPDGYMIVGRLPMTRKIHNKMKDGYAYKVVQISKPDEALVYTAFLSPTCYGLRYEKERRFENRRAATFLYVGKMKELYPEYKFPVQFRLTTVAPAPPVVAAKTLSAADKSLKDTVRGRVLNKYPPMPPTEKDVDQYITLLQKGDMQSARQLDKFVGSFIAPRANAVILKDNNGTLQAPNYIYYHGGALASDDWNKLANTNFSCSPVFNLPVANIVNYLGQDTTKDFTILKFTVSLLYSNTEDAQPPYKEAKYVLIRSKVDPPPSLRELSSTHFQLVISDELLIPDDK